jgi:hypothetical protein
MIAHQRAKIYIQDQFYRDLARKQNLTWRQVLKRAERRHAAIYKLCGLRTIKYLGPMRLDNPFIESHAWKFLVREALRNSARCRTQSQARSARKS